MTKHPTPFWKWLHCHRTHYIMVFWASSHQGTSRVYKWYKCCRQGANQPGLPGTLVQGWVVRDAEGRDRNCWLVLCPVEFYQPRKERLILVCTKESSSGQGFPARHLWGVSEVPGDARNAVQTESRTELPSQRLTHFYSSNSQVTFSLQQQKS